MLLERYGDPKEEDRDSRFIHEIWFDGSITIFSNGGSIYCKYSKGVGVGVGVGEGRKRKEGGGVWFVLGGGGGGGGKKFVDWRRKREEKKKGIGILEMRALSSFLNQFIIIIIMLGLESCGLGWVGLTWLGNGIGKLANWQIGIGLGLG
ncbi:hypothetical protein Dimus_009364 [Dionaea muscipula]